MPRIDIANTTRYDCDDIGIANLMSQIGWLRYQRPMSSIQLLDLGSEFFACFSFLSEATAIVSWDMLITFFC